ncbi:MAG: hypothetical protein EXR99_05735 [Gemmataceae bacterium]|nr:hypothetical protein [Gemmataceae bacterium]
MKKALLIFLSIGLGGFLLTGLTQILPGERAVVRRFGHLLPDQPGPGLRVGFPWGIDRVDRVAVDRVNQMHVGYIEDDGGVPLPTGQMLTGDNNLVNAGLSVHYKVDAARLVEYAMQKETALELLTRAVESAAAEWIASRGVDEVLLEGKLELGRFAARAAQELVRELGLGLEILDVRVGLLAPPDEVKPAFDAVARAQTGVRTLVNKAEQEAALRVSQGEADRFRIQQETRAWVDNLHLQARTEAKRFLTRLRNYQTGVRINPTYLRQIWEEERGKVFAKLKEQGAIGLIDSTLGKNGLDLQIIPLAPKK